MTKILLVEDNEMNRDMLMWRRGYEVVIAVGAGRRQVLAMRETTAAGVRKSQICHSEAGI